MFNVYSMLKTNKHLLIKIKFSLVFLDNFFIILSIFNRFFSYKIFITYINNICSLVFKLYVKYLIIYKFKKKNSLLRPTKLKTDNLFYYT